MKRRKSINKYANKQKETNNKPNKYDKYEIACVGKGKKYNDQLLALMTATVAINAICKGSGGEYYGR